MEWILTNLPTILICLVLGALLVLAVIYIIRSHSKPGGGGCSGCTGCAFKEQCNSKKENKDTQ